MLVRKKNKPPKTLNIAQNQNDDLGVYTNLVYAGKP